MAFAGIRGNENDGERTGAAVPGHGCAARPVDRAAHPRGTAPGAYLRTGPA